jgi:hypothetical protein
MPNGDSSFRNFLEKQNVSRFNRLRKKRQPTVAEHTMKENRKLLFGGINRTGFNESIRRGKTIDGKAICLAANS